MGEEVFLPRIGTSTDCNVSVWLAVVSHPELEGQNIANNEDQGGKSRGNWVGFCTFPT